MRANWHRIQLPPQKDGSIKVHDFRALISEIEGVLVETKQEEDSIPMMQHKVKIIEMSYPE